MMAPVYAAPHVSPRVERMAGKAMLAMRIKEGFVPVIGKACSHINHYACRALRAMDGGAMYRDDLIDLADVGECDVMARALDRLLSNGVVRSGSHNGRETIMPTDKSDDWLAENSRQGSLF